MICFHFVTDWDLYSYADDNNLSISSNDINSLKNNLESNTLILVKWFEDNQMHTNPDIFQAICIGKKTKEENICFEIDGIRIQPENGVKLLDVPIYLNLI